MMVSVAPMSAPVAAKLAAVAAPELLMVNVLPVTQQAHAGRARDAQRAA